MEDTQLSKLKQTLSFVLKNPYSSFYKRKFKDISVSSIKSISDFQKLPFLTREEIAKTPASLRLFVPEGKVVSWSISSGTTDEPIIIPKMAHADDPAMDVLAKQLKKTGARKVLALTRATFLGTRTRIWLSHPKLARYPFIYGDINNLSLMAKLARSIGVDAIDTTSSILYLFLPFLQESYELGRIKFITLTGEAISKTKLKFFKSYFKDAFFCLRYGGSEYPVQNGFRCDFLAGLAPRFFHPNTDFYFYEVLDGEQVVTTLKPCAFPLIRYRTGDAIAFYERPCPCGQREILEALGRVGYDFVRVAGGTIHASSLDKVIAHALGSQIRYQLHIYETVFSNKLVPKLVLEIGEPQTTDKINKIKKGLEENLYLGRRLNLKYFIEQELIAPLEIVVKPVSGGSKTLRIVSHLA